MTTIGDYRTPGFKLFLVIIVGLVLTVPLFSIWLLVYDRQSQEQEATSSITAGWGAAQVISGPLLVIPYRSNATETVVQNGQSVTRTNEVTRELELAPETAGFRTELMPQVRKRSIYEAVVYDARNDGHARFSFPADLARTGIDASQLDFDRAELRFGVSDPRGLGANPKVLVDGEPLRLQPGGGSGGGRGFFAPIDASGFPTKSLIVDFSFDLRGNESLSLAPQAGDTRWTVSSSWPSPNFAGDFLPDGRSVGATGFNANYRIGNLALGRSLVSTSDADSPDGSGPTNKPTGEVDGNAGSNAHGPQAQIAQINLIQPVDLYLQVNRATKYGFLFIGFTFLALLMFDVIGGVRISAVEYLLMGAALILFFVLLLAFAEVIGFTLSYVLASAAIAGLNTAYSAAVLASWRRSAFIGALLVALYGVLYILLSLEAFSLLIGSSLLFGALAGVMYTTRRIDWGSPRTVPANA